MTAVLVALYICFGLLFWQLTVPGLRARAYWLVLLLWPWFVAIEGTPIAYRFIERNRRG